MQLDRRAQILLNELFSLGSATVMYENEPDDVYCTIFWGFSFLVFFWSSTTTTKLGHPKTTLAAGPAHTR